MPAGPATHHPWTSGSSSHSWTAGRTRVLVDPCEPTFHMAGEQPTCYIYLLQTLGSWRFTRTNHLRDRCAHHPPTPHPPPPPHSSFHPKTRGLHGALRRLWLYARVTVRQKNTFIPHLTTDAFISLYDRAGTPLWHSITSVWQCLHTPWLHPFSYYISVRIFELGILAFAYYFRCSTFSYHSGWS